MAYEVICSVFLLKLINDSTDEFDDSHDLSGDDTTSKVAKVVVDDMKYQRQHVISRLCAYGGQTQLFMLLTGPAGAGKSTAGKDVEQFCMQF